MQLRHYRLFHLPRRKRLRMIWGPSPSLALTGSFSKRLSIVCCGFIQIGFGFGLEEAVELSGAMSQLELLKWWFVLQSDVIGVNYTRNRWYARRNDDWDDCLKRDEELKMGLWQVYLSAVVKGGRYAQSRELASWSLKGIRLPNVLSV